VDRMTAGDRNGEVTDCDAPGLQLNLGCSFPIRRLKDTFRDIFCIKTPILDSSQ
jgi:hypothetical protein